MGFYATITVSYKVRLSTSERCIYLYFSKRFSGAIESIQNSCLPDKVLSSAGK